MKPLQPRLPPQPRSAQTVLGGALDFRQCCRHERFWHALSFVLLKPAWSGVTAHHLRDMLNTATLAQLIAWSNEPGLLPRVPYGLERGRYWHDLDDALLERFTADRDEDVRFSAQNELSQRRDGSTQARIPAQGKLL